VAKQAATVELFYNGVWNDHTSDLYRRNSIAINHGVLDGQSGLAPSDATLTFQTRDGRMNPENRRSPLFGLIGEGTQFRIKDGSDIRLSGRAVGWRPQRSIGGTKFDAWVDVTVQGTIRRLGRGEQPMLRSPVFRTWSGVAPNGYVPLAYWPMEDGHTATQFAAAIPGNQPMVPAGSVDFAADRGVAGSDPLPVFAAGASAVAPVPAYTATTKWVAMFTMKIPSEPASKTTFAEFTVAGANETLWRLVYNPSFNTVDIETYNSTGGLVNTIQVTELTGGFDWTPSEADFFGTWATYLIASVNTGGSNVSHWGGLTIGPEIALTGHLGTADGHGSITSVRPLGGNGASIGHYAVYVDPAFGISASDPDAVNNSAAVFGWAGETAGARFTRLCREEGIVSSIVGTEASTQPMGPQVGDTLLNHFDEIAKTDAGIIYDTREAEGLTLRTGRSLNNQTPAVTLTWGAGHIGEPLLPVIDDSVRKNVVVAKRRNGSEFTDSDTTGPKGTAAIGAYKLPVDINPATDDVLPLHAHYHLVLGTDPDPRYPKVVVDLDANPGLKAAVTAANVGSLVALQGIPPELGQPDAEILILGYTEVIGSHRRVITLNSRPGGILSHVGKLDGGASACLQTPGAQLANSITDVQASATVATTSGPLFTTSPPAGAAIIIRDLEIATVTGIASALTDTFARSVSPSWGTADSGQTWSCSPEAAFLTTGTKGLIGVNVVDTVFKAAIADIGDTVEATVLCEPNAVAAGGFFEQRIRVRDNGSARIEVVLRYQTTGLIDVLVQTQAAVLSTLASHLTYNSASVLGVRVQVTGDTLRHRVWDTAGSEPDVWHATVTTSVLGSAADSFALVAFRASDNTQAGLAVEFDTVVMSNPQTFTVTRDPSQAMAHPAGSSVKVYRALRLTL